MSPIEIIHQCWEVLENKNIRSEHSYGYFYRHCFISKAAVRETRNPEESSSPSLNSEHVRYTAMSSIYNQEQEI